MKTPALSFSVDEQHFENGTFRKRSPEQMKLKKFRLGVSVWTENYCCVFKVKTPFLNLSGVVWTGTQRISLAADG